MTARSARDLLQALPLSVPGQPVAPARVALVRPPTLQILGSLSYLGAIPPIGLAYVAAVLSEAGHEVHVLDAACEALDQFVKVDSPLGSLYLNGLTPEQVVQRLPAGIQVLGITHMFLHEWPTVRALAELAKARFPGLVVVLGGENASAFWPYILAQTEAVDCCVVGEGEAAMLDLVACVQAGRPLEGIPGLACRGLQGAPSPRPRIRALDQLPLPAWHLFPVENYFRAADAFGVHRGRSMPLVASRGCPFQCTMCSSPSMWTTRYFTRPPRDVTDEIELYVRRYAISNIDFCDLTPILERRWILEFCLELEARSLPVTWQLPVGTRSEVLDAEVLRRMYAAGCRNLSFSPESGSERLLALLKKNVDLRRLMTSVVEARKAGLVTRINVILGHPEERRSDVWQTLKYALEGAWRGCHDLAVMMFSPYPGSEDHERLRAAGKLGSQVDYYVALARSGHSRQTFNPAMGSRELLLLQLSMMAAFYGVAYLRSPGRLLRLVKSLLTGREEDQMEQLLRTKLRQFRLALKSWFRGRSKPD